MAVSIMQPIVSVEEKSATRPKKFAQAKLQTDSFEGYVYTLNLGTSFNASSNFTTVLQNQTVAGGTASNLAPNYIDGVMFSNENEFYLYGFVEFAQAKKRKFTDYN